MEPAEADVAPACGFEDNAPFGIRRALSFAAFEPHTNLILRAKRSWNVLLCALGIFRGWFYRPGGKSECADGMLSIA